MGFAAISALLVQQSALLARPGGDSFSPPRQHTCSSRFTFQASFNLAKQITSTESAGSATAPELNSSNSGRRRRSGLDEELEQLKFGLGFGLVGPAAAAAAAGGAAVVAGWKRIQSLARDLKRGSFRNVYH